MTSYITVLDKTAEFKDWGVLELIRKLAVDVRPALLEGLILQVSQKYDDQAVVRYFALLLHAIEDVVLIPCLVGGDIPDRGDEYATYHRARTDVEKTCAEAIMRVLSHLPTEKEVKGQYAGETRQEAVLTTSRSKMLETICARWRATRDEDEADQILAYLIALSHQWQRDTMRLDGLIGEAVKRATDQHFPTPRLLRHLTTARMPETLRRHLAVAFARDAEHNYFLHLLQISRPLAECSEEAQTRAMSIANQLAKLDNTVDILRACFDGGDEAMRRVVGRGYSYCPRLHGRLDVSYTADATELTLSAPMNSFSHPRDENRFHEWFDSAKTLVERWQTMFPHSVRFKAIATVGGMVEHKREQTFMLP